VTLTQGDGEGLVALGRHILEQSPGAILIGAGGIVLDQLARQLVNVLRQHGANGDVQVAILFEMSRELLLDRFNQRIAHLSVQDARLEKQLPALQVWVLHVSDDEQVSRALLLARLVHDFPGAGVRLVMLASPSAEANLGTGPEVQRLLRCRVIADPGAGAGAGAGASAGADEPREAPTPTSARPSRRSGTSGRMLRLVIGGLLALGFSALVVVFLLPARSQRPAEVPVAVAEPVAPSRESDVPGAPQREPIGLPADVDMPVQAGASAALPPAGTPVGEPGGEQVGEPGVQKPAAEAPAQAVISGPAPPSTPPPGPPPGPPPTRPAGPPAPPAPTAPTATEGRDWVLGLVRSQWVVQHVAARSRAEAQAWRLRTPALADARIVALARREEGEHYFVVVSGPFADRDAAARFVQQQGLAATTWIRGAASLKASLPPEDSRR
jgi:hypothetical protein